MQFAETSCFIVVQPLQLPLATNSPFLFLLSISATIQQAWLMRGFFVYFFLVFLSGRADADLANCFRNSDANQPSSATPFFLPFFTLRWNQKRNGKLQMILLQEERMRLYYFSVGIKVEQERDAKRKKEDRRAGASLSSLRGTISTEKISASSSRRSVSLVDGRTQKYFREVRAGP